MANTPDEYLQLWFKYLTELQSCAQQISSDTPDDIVDFANTKHAGILAGTPQQDQFKSCVFVRSHLYIPDSAFTKAATFFDFLEYIYSPLHGYILGVFQSVAGAAFSTLLPPDFDSKPAIEVFPTSGAKQTLVKCLTDDMPSSWFPPAKVTPFLTLLGTAGKKIKDSIDFIAKAGASK